MQVDDGRGLLEPGKGRPQIQILVGVCARDYDGSVSRGFPGRLAHVNFFRGTSRICTLMIMILPQRT